MKRLSSIIANTGMLLLILALLIPAPASAKTYILVWQSDWPIDAESVTVEVIGGTLTSTRIAPDGKSGQVDVTAPVECVTIRWSAQAQAGFPVASITRSWLDECPHIYLPIFMR